MEQEKLGCSICLDLLKDPVTIPCGHSYCMNCIKQCWELQSLGQIYSCPQCRQTFRPRPDLKKNTVLADLVEEVKKTISEAASADLCSAGPGDVSCDFCTGRKLKAVKSCLQCLVSYCDQHLQPHYQSPAFKKHKLVDPSKKLEERICSRHDKMMEIFCRTDQQCICYLCLDEHRRHDTVSAEAERKDKQQVVVLNQEKIQQRIREKEEGVKVLQQEIAELRRRSSELELLSQTDDHIQFLQNYTLLGRLSEDTDFLQAVVKESTESSQIKFQPPVFEKRKRVPPSERLQAFPDKFTIALFGKNPEFNKSIQHQILNDDITSDKTLNDFASENNSFRIISTHDIFDEKCLHQDQKMIDSLARSYDDLHLFILAVDSQNSQLDEVVSQIYKLQKTFGKDVTQHLVVLFEIFSSYTSLSSQLKEKFHIKLGVLSEHLVDDCKKWCSSGAVFKYNYKKYVEEVKKRRENKLKGNKDHRERLGSHIESQCERTSSMLLRENFMEFNIVLLGQTGTGKSASGNTILTAVNPEMDPSQLFESRPGSFPVTSKCEFKEINVFGRKVRVVDTPDFFDEDIDSQVHVDECKKYCQKGSCVVLLVIQMGRFTDGEKGILERLEKKLGWKIREKTIVLLTHGEKAKGQEQRFIVERTYLNSMVQACGNRYHVFKNTSKNPKQVIELFKKFPDFQKIFPQFTEKTPRNECCIS